MAWKFVTKFRWLLICVVILGSQNTDLTWNLGHAEQTIFHAYTHPPPSPIFNLENLQGEMVDIQDYQGRVILLNFWATW